MNATKISLSEILTLLSKEDFWAGAFDRNAPFYESYLKYFKNGVIDGVPESLDYNREAIYYLKDNALAPVITQLIRWATKYSDASFIESLSFFLSKKEQKDRLTAAFKTVDSNVVASLVNDLDSLSAYLADTWSKDISEELLVFRALLVDL